MLDVAERCPAENLSARPASAETAAPASEIAKLKAFLADRLARAKRLPQDQIFGETIEITPLMAQYILDAHNTRNRPVSQAKVRELARQIRAGQLMVTHQGLSFATDDAMNNGQHRLLACILANIPIKVYVAFNETPKAFEVLDKQRPRNGSDTLAILGFKYTTVLAAAARQFSIVTSDNPLSNASLDNQEVIAIVQANLGLEDACVPGGRIGKRLGCSSAATTAAFYLIGKHSRHADKLAFFVDKLSDPSGLGNRNVILTLRDGLMKKELDKQFRSGGNRAAAQIAAIIKAWNLWVTKSRITSDILWLSGEDFPKPV